jgi:hypothetical protein
MFKKYFILACLTVTGIIGYSQNPKPDSVANPVDNDLAIDTSIDYDDLLNELDLFLDSILTPRSYFFINLSTAQGYFNFVNSNNTRVEVVQKFIWSPTLGYYHKNGMGLTLTGYLINNNKQLNLYQASVSASYDYLKNRDLATGISYLRYFTKDSLSFYTSPLQNEVYGYFLWRKSWVQPGIAASYGWGSRADYKERERYIRLLRLKRLLRRFGYVVLSPVTTVTEESIVDFSLTASLRHNFYWLNIFSAKDHIRFTPQLSFASGTQKFGFNQTTGTYGISRYNVVYNAGNVNLDSVQKFQPLSLTFYLRSDYSLGKFFIQPQLIFDYYFPAREKNFTSLFSLNAGFIF